jgi:hypothetical protein
MPCNSSLRNEARADRPRRPARCVVLSRPHSTAATWALYVLASHSAIAPGRRVVIPK